MPILRKCYCLASELRRAHLSAAFGTAPADFRALSHLTIGVLMGFAQRCTGFAYFRTLAAKVRMVRGATTHEIGRDGAELCTVEQRNQMLSLRMAPAAMQHMRDRFGADLVAVEAGLEAIRNCTVHLFHVISPERLKESQAC